MQGKMAPFLLARLEWSLDQAKLVSLLSPGSLSVIDFFERDGNILEVSM